MRRAPELVWSAAAGIVATAAYLGLTRSAGGDPGDAVGHAFGAVGFLLMLATETLYSVRKRVRDRAWGPMRRWLRLHIFTGILGPWLVLLHTSLELRGLAGAATVATGVVVASGFVGRYLYTRIPRTAAGDEAPGIDPRALLRARRLLALWHTVHVPLGAVLFVLAVAHVAAALYYAAGAR